MNHASNSQNAIVIMVAGMMSAVRVMAERFVEVIGSPAAMMKNGALYDETRQRALRWLNDMEAVVRRFLLLRAALFPAPPAACAGARANQTGAAHSLSRGIAPPWRKEADPRNLYGPPENPSDWRVCFRIEAEPLPGWLRYDPYAKRRAFVCREPAQKNAKEPFVWADDPRPLAERLEAVLRVLENPDWYAERLAARLHRWSGSQESRQNLLRALCATAQIANEAGLDDEAWALFGEAREMAQALLPVFAYPDRIVAADSG